MEHSKLRSFLSLALVLLLGFTPYIEPSYSGLSVGLENWCEGNPALRDDRSFSYFVSHNEISHPVLEGLYYLPSEYSLQQEYRLSELAELWEKWGYYKTFMLYSITRIGAVNNGTGLEAAYRLIAEERSEPTALMFPVFKMESRSQLELAAFSSQSITDNSSIGAKMRLNYSSVIEGEINYAELENFQLGDIPQKTSFFGDIDLGLSYHNYFLQAELIAKHLGPIDFWGEKQSSRVLLKAGVSIISYLYTTKFRTSIEFYDLTDELNTSFKRRFRFKTEAYLMGDKLRLSAGLYDGYPGVGGVFYRSPLFLSYRLITLERGYEPGQKPLLMHALELGYVQKLFE